ncbi:aldo/keto reductase [Streptomyces sp. NPDC091292]|uniref:aldo/keto reductase n=1 Tax=Streptomyces sp. NPDC091292 TaxID=3365991 RepID=UPI0038023570
MISETFAIAGEVSVGRLGYGTAQLTGPGYWGPRGSTEDAVALLRAAVDGGVTLIDTAANYGPSVAEELIAEALHPYAPGLTVATKGGVVRTGPDVCHVDGHPDRLRAMCEASLRRLRVDTIDLYQLHRLDPGIPLADQLGALAELRRAGKVRHVGLDSVTPEQFEAAVDLGIVDIVSVQNRYHVLDRASEPLLKLCEARGVAFLPWFPLGNGSLADDPVCADIARARGVSPAQVALAWLLQHSPVLCPTPGTSTVAHLTDNLAAARLRLSPQDVARLDALA